MSAPGWLRHEPRPFPSCNLTLARGRDAVLLVDTGYGSDGAATLDLLRAEAVDPASVVVFNTHWHSDHVGGNALLQREYGTRVLAWAPEGELVNARHPDACAADYLDQPVEAYRVDELLEADDVIDLGGVRLRVVATPGHSLGHASLFDEASGTLVAGDALMDRDVAWINPFLDGAGALDTALATMERLRSLGARAAVAGHGPPIDDVEAAIERSAGRLRAWREDRSAMTWHGARRVFAYALMIRGGLARSELAPYLARRRWVADFARATGLEPAEFATRLVADMAGRGAAWRPEGDQERLVATLPHTPPPAGWQRSPGFPAAWAAGA